MMRQALIIAAVVAFLLNGCAKKTEVPQATSTPEASGAAQANPQAATPSGAKMLKVTLSPIQGSQISGTAIFTQSGPVGTRVQVNVTGAGSTGQLAAQLRGGTCADPGQIDGADTWQLAGGTTEGPVLGAATLDELTAKPTIVVIIPVITTAGSAAIFSCGKTKQ